MKLTIDRELRLKTLEAIHDSAVDAIITINPAGLIEMVNSAAEKLFGYSGDELIGKNVNLLMPNPYHDQHDQYLENYLRTRQPKIIGIGREVVGLKKDGSMIPIHLAVSEVQIDDRRVFAGFVRDLSDLKRIEQHEATLGRIVENSLNEIYIFDAETFRFILVNRGACENLGYSHEEIRQRTPLDIKPDFTPEKFREQVSQPLVSKQMERLSLTTRHRRKDGTDYDVELHLHLARYENQTVIVAVAQDITRRREAERRLAEQRDRMQAELERQVELRTAELRETQAALVQSEKYSTLGKVAGGIAHEIRNPLNAVKTSAYFLLKARNPSAEKVEEHLNRIDRQVTMIDNVITALADVAKLPEADLRPIDILSILKRVVQGTNLPGNIKVRYEFPDPAPQVLADENQIVIAFRNLIRNARDAMPDGGALTLRCREEDHQVLIEVIDSGMGIASDQLEKILEPLFTTKARGMGLGLSITLAIVEKNRAKLEIESELGKGSCFRVNLARHRTP